MESRFFHQRPNENDTGRKRPKTSENDFETKVYHQVVIFSGRFVVFLVFCFFVFCVFIVFGKTFPTEICKHYIFCIIVFASRLVCKTP